MFSILKKILALVFYLVISIYFILWLYVFGVAPDWDSVTVGDVTENVMNSNYSNPKGIMAIYFFKILGFLVPLIILFVVYMQIKMLITFISSLRKGDKFEIVLQNSIDSFNTLRWRPKNK